MYLQHRQAAATMLWVPFLLFAGMFLVEAKNQSPRVSRTGFDYPPDNLQYFEDTNVVLVHEREPGRLWRSTDAGEKWKKVGDIPDGGVFKFYLHPYNNEVAYALGRENKHYKTGDRGESWDRFELPDGTALSEFHLEPIRFHAKDSKKVILITQDCNSRSFCEEITYYTTDGFKSNHILREETRGCLWARSSDIFETTSEDKDDSRIICIVKGKYSPDFTENRLLWSDDFFKNEKEPPLEADRAVAGIINMASVKKYIVAAAKAKGSRELALYVTADAKVWHRAMFPHEHKLEEDAYTILESTNYSIQVDVLSSMRPRNPMGVLFTSNSNGTYFTKNVRHTNRNAFNIVDFEKIQGIQGIVLVNVVDNWQEVEQGQLVDKKIKSKISFDDGRIFQHLEVGKKELHIHSVTDMANIGRTYSSAAPGIVMAVGNTGEYLRPYSEGDLYVSDDAGLTWQLAREEAHKYEFGDQGNVLMAIYDEGPADKIAWSTNHGKDWSEAKLEDGKVDFKMLTTMPDSTSLKFVAVGVQGGGAKTKFWVYSFDFEDVVDDDCEDGDFEDWYARVGEDGKPSCIMGHTQKFRRRKTGAKCFVRKETREPMPKTEPCKCSKQDYECDFNFEDKGDGQCEPATTLSAPKYSCEDSHETFMAPSGYRRISGNDCEGGEDLTGEKERPCSETVKKPKSGKISTEKTTFKATQFSKKVYLERTEVANGDDETVIMRTDKGEIYLSKDHGKTWKQVLKDVNVYGIIQHSFEHDRVFFITKTKKIWYTINRGETFDSFEAPHPINGEDIFPLSFHEDKPDTFIWIGAVSCGVKDRRSDCHSVASVTHDRGDSWKTMVRACRRCEFINKKLKKENDKDDLVYCEAYEGENRQTGSRQLKYSTSYFDDKVETPFNDIVAFATMSEYIVVAYKGEGEDLMVDTSVDGRTYARAEFPRDFQVDHKTSYTVLDSSMHAVFLHVTVSAQQGFEYGRLMKSNSNGTSYVSTEARVNRNELGFVDFEKMQGLEGVAMVNIVTNSVAGDKDEGKKLRTLITHNDGGAWNYVEPPKLDVDGNKFACWAGIEVCSLNLHGYTERPDPKDTYSSTSAVGLMIGVGNVGTQLGRKEEADTFITRDGGVSWKQVKKGNYMWEYGDQGGIIVIVEENVATRVLFYTLDEGKSWTEYKFSDTDMLIGDLTTVPSDSSVNFLLWGRESSNNREIMTINVDFSGLREGQCNLDKEDPGSEKSDYYLWSPKHPKQDNDCLFGHVAQYYRKKLDKECWNGRKIRQDRDIKENCECGALDFECDYNYERKSDNTCALVPGYDPPDHSAICKESSDQKTYYDPTGYRRIPASTCKGGNELEKYEPNERPCPGYESDFEEEHRGLSGFAFFLVAILLPFSAAGAIGYWVWRNWDGKFGRIQLGDGPSGRGAFSADQPWIQYPVMAVSALVAIVAAVPLLVASLWRSASSWVGGRGSGSRRYTTRDSFARSRGQYAVIDPEEDALFGDEEDEN